MEDCFVVKVDNYATTVPVVDGNYENVNIVHVYPQGIFSQANQVIAVTPASAKTTELHPLEAEVQRSLESSRQGQLSNGSVIQSLPAVHSNTTSVVRTLTRIVPSETQEHNVCLVTNGSHIKDDGLEGGGDKILWLSPNSHAISFSETVLGPSQQRDDIIEIDPTQIPVTVQSCCETAPAGVKGEEDSCSDEESIEITPVYDDEPDPDIPSDLLVNEDIDISDMTNRCYMCFKKFRQKKNMYAHIRRIHSTQPKLTGGIVCPLCKMTALRQEHLRSHIESLHEVKIEKEERQFDSVQEFLTWKRHIEKETLSIFISKSSPKVLAFNQTKSYFKCHRSGYYVPDKLEKKRKKTKAQVSSKIGATCPAAMEVTENVNGVTVTFWSTHVGHTQDVKHLLITKEERDKLGDFFNSSDILWEDVLDNGPNEELASLKFHEPSMQPVTIHKRKKTSEGKLSFGRKPRTGRVLKSAPQSEVIEKAQNLLHILRTTEVQPQFRPQICLMIDNVISTVRRRALNNGGGKKRKVSRVFGGTSNCNVFTDSYSQSSGDEHDFHSDTPGSDEMTSQAVSVKKSRYRTKSRVMK